MKHFIFDECLNDKRIVNKWNEQGKCTTRRFPEKLRGTKDPKMLPEVLSGNAPLVTTDSAIVAEHRAHIPLQNAGIFTVRLRRPSRTMTAKIAATLLSGLKAKFPNWAEKDWRNICLQVTEIEIHISRIPDVRPENTFSASYELPDFEARITYALTAIRASMIQVLEAPVA